MHAKWMLWPKNVRKAENPVNNYSWASKIWKQKKTSKNQPLKRWSEYIVAASTVSMVSYVMIAVNYWLKPSTWSASVHIALSLHVVSARQIASVLSIKRRWAKLWNSLGLGCCCGIQFWQLTIYGSWGCPTICCAGAQKGAPGEHGVKRTYALY